MLLSFSLRKECRVDGLKLLRKEAGMTLEGLAEASGVSVPTIWNTEHDITSPSVTTLEKIAKALNVSVADLLYADEVLARRQAVEERAKEYATVA
jgi:transcriptional regulator with XRE-family HTH domain